MKRRSVFFLDGIKEMTLIDLNGNKPPKKVANKTDAPDRNNLRVLS